MRQAEALTPVIESGRVVGGPPPRQRPNGFVPYAPPKSSALSSSERATDWGLFYGKDSNMNTIHHVSWLHQMPQFAATKAHKTRALADVSTAETTAKTTNPATKPLTALNGNLPFRRLIAAVDCTVLPAAHNNGSRAQYLAVEL